MDRDIVETLRTATVTSKGIDLERAGLKGPSSTWTYLINDDPFQDHLGIHLTGNAGVAAATALYAGPFLVLWGLCNRFLRRRSSSRSRTGGQAER